MGAVALHEGVGDVHLHILGDDFLYRFANSNEKDKNRVLDDIRETLRTCSDEELEQMISRKQMQSL